MLKKVAMLLGVFGAAAVLTGCSSLQTASVADFNKQEVVTSGTAVEHIAVATHGLYLFSIPLITGSTDQYGMPTLVTDTVSPQALTADRIHSTTAVKKSTGIPRVWAAARARMEMVMAAPPILMVAPRGIDTA